LTRYYHQTIVETAVGKVTDKALIFVFTHCLFV